MSKQEVFHTCRAANRTFTQEEWFSYCDESNRDATKRLVTRKGKYCFNDFDICLNPEYKMLGEQGGGYGYYVTLKWADCGNGLWSYGLDYNTGTGGGGFGVSWAEVTGHPDDWRNGYQSERECLLAACDEAITRLEHSGHPGAKLEKLKGLVQDYKKSLQRPKVTQLELF